MLAQRKPNKIIIDPYKNLSLMAIAKTPIKRNNTASANKQIVKIK